VTGNNDEITIAANVEALLLQAATPLTPPAGLRARVLQHVSAAVSQPLTLRDSEGWQPLLPGIEVKQLLVDRQAGTRSILLRAAPGACLPAHPHHGYEECLVLQGEIQIGELTLRPGDYHCMPAGSIHPEVSARSAALVFLRSALEDIR
jgi:anti-sigma factor ChrR (cupin superfamily)